MIPNTEQTQTQIVSYDMVAQNFSEEAKSLIPDSTIEQVLAKEKIRFENAVIMQIPITKLVGNNTLRYCKNLLRGKQPLPFLYSVLCFLTETSILMLLYGAVMGIYGNLTAEKGGFFAPFSFLYALILFAGIIGYHTLSKRQLLKILSTPFSNSSPAKQEVDIRKKALRHHRMVSLLIVLVLMVFTAGLVCFFDLNSKYSARLSACFFAYVACMISFGIHNVVYNSHLISFFAIGGLLAVKRPMEEIHTATEQYLNLSCQQLLSLSHKNLEDIKNNPGLTDKLKATIHSRMKTERIYYILAIVILLILDIICIGQIRSMATLTLLVFFIISILLTLLLFVALLAANHILKHTKQR